MGVGKMMCITHIKKLFINLLTLMTRQKEMRATSTSSEERKNIEALGKGGIRGVESAGYGGVEEGFFFFF